MKAAVRQLSYLVFMLLSAGSSPGAAQEKPASQATVMAQKAASLALPAEDPRDRAFAERGFLATRKDPLIKAPDGQVVWDLAAYDFIKGNAPSTVNPSLWRQMQILRIHGLFQVAENIWQVRGFDVANMTVIWGNSGWIIVDPLSTSETAAAALELVNATLGSRPVSAVVYTHSHGDHFGGVRGVVEETDVLSGKVPVLAPEKFAEEAASESIMAGPAMFRRAIYQAGLTLPVGIQGHVGNGHSIGAPRGSSSLIAPTDIIHATGEARTINGVKIEFQMVPNTEAPAEFNLYLESPRVFLIAEFAGCSLHNLLPPRGAKVRDGRAWAMYLDEAARVYAPKSDAFISSHCWPRLGTAEGVSWLSSQRDNYRYLHDQTVRAMNKGETPGEVAESLLQPQALASQWFNRPYYGTYKSNVRAIYQAYLGWYDAIPAHLDPLPPAEAATRYVAAMGGATRVLQLARAAMQQGDYRWSSELLNQLVFADPANKQARELLADSYEQQGYQAESGIWRNQFLSAAQDLRKDAQSAPRQVRRRNALSATPTQELLDSIATRFNPLKSGGRKLRINLVLTDRSETASFETTETVLIGRMVSLANSDATVRAPRSLLEAWLFDKAPLEDLRSKGLVVEGDPSAVTSLADSLEQVPGWFNIVEP